MQLLLCVVGRLDEMQMPFRICCTNLSLAETSERAQASTLLLPTSRNKYLSSKNEPHKAMRTSVHNTNDGGTATIDGQQPQSIVTLANWMSTESSSERKQAQTHSSRLQKTNLLEAQ